MFREIIQNADDAEATEVRIEFQTSDYAINPAGAMNGTTPDMNTEVSFKVMLSSYLALKLPDSCSNGLFVTTAPPLETTIGSG